MTSAACRPRTTWKSPASSPSTNAPLRVDDPRIDLDVVDLGAEGDRRLAAWPAGGGCGPAAGPATRAGRTRPVRASARGQGADSHGVHAHRQASQYRTAADASQIMGRATRSRARGFSPRTVRTARKRCADRASKHVGGCYTEILCRSTSRAVQDGPPRRGARRLAAATTSRESNPIAQRLAGLGGGGHLATRRWFYLIPASGRAARAGARHRAAQSRSPARAEDALCRPRRSSKRG